MLFSSPLSQKHAFKKLLTICFCIVTCQGVDNLLLKKQHTSIRDDLHSTFKEGAEL